MPNTITIPASNNEIIDRLDWVYRNIYTLILEGAGEPKKCEHANTIDVGDEEHSVIACTQCEKIL